MFDKSRGLKWYRAIQFFTGFSIFMNFGAAFIGPTVPGFSSEEILNAIPIYDVYFRLASFAVCVESIILLRKLCAYDSDMIRHWKILTFLLITAPVAHLLIFCGLYRVPMTVDIMLECISRVIILALWRIPTLVYLKKRCFPKRYATKKQQEATEKSIFIENIDDGLDFASDESFQAATIQYCRFCGNKLRNESRYCDSCGKKVQQ